MIRDAHHKVLIVYAEKNGAEPFSEWIEGLRDVIGRKRILTRLERVAWGNAGDCDWVGDGVCELRMFFGPGYRVYFGEDANNQVVLLCGGDKDSQEQDIRRAKEYWTEYLNAKAQNI